MLSGYNHKAQFQPLYSASNTEKTYRKRMC